MKFNSQICTTREQSERLLALGLRKETADMCLDIESNVSSSELPRAFTLKNRHRIIPAWSLLRLIEILNIQVVEIWDDKDAFECIINMIAKRIEFEWLNKEFLK